VRLRAGATGRRARAATGGAHPGESRRGFAGDVALDLRATPRGVMLHGNAELFVAEPSGPEAGGLGSMTRGAGQPPAWRRMTHGPDVLLDRVTLIAAGSPAHRRVALFRPPAREWTGSPPVVDTLLADDTSSVGDRSRRAYPYGAALARDRLGQSVRRRALARARWLDPRGAPPAGHPPCPRAARSRRLRSHAIGCARRARSTA